jgi:hypothetical protein
LKINFGRALGGKFTEGYKRADWKQQGSADGIGKGGSYLYSFRKSADFCLEEKSAGAVSVYEQKRLADLSLSVIVRVLVMLGKYFVSVKYEFVCIKLVCVM